MTILQTVEGHFSTLNLRYRRLDDTHLESGFAGYHSACRLLVGERDGLLGFIVPEIVIVAVSRLGEALRLANLLNATRLAWGAFWIHPETRVLVFELAFPAAEPPSLEHTIAALAATTAADAFYPAFMAVIWGTRSADEALAELSLDDPTEDAPLEPDAGNDDENDLDLAV